MPIQKNSLPALFAGLVLVLTLAMLGGTAQAAYDLNGDWTFSYSNPATGDTYSDPCVIQQNGNRISGQSTYEIEGQVYHDTFEGLINPDGSVVFTLYEDGGDPVYHTGQISPDGNTITGSWSIGDNKGSFTISRGSGQTVSTGAAPDLSGNWNFSFTNPEGTTFTDPAVIKQNGNRISGTLSYELDGQTYTEPFEGIVSPNGTVEFTLNDQGTLVQHTGTISPDGNSVSGNWSIQDGEQGPFTLARAGSGATPPITNNAPANLTGDWVFAFETADGKSFSDPCTIQQNGNSLSGMVTYYENGEEIQEPFDGTIQPDGTVNFTLYDMGQAVPHTGKLSPDGNTITGTWSYDDGSGTFTITRGGYVTGMPAPNTPSQGSTGGNTGGTANLTGNWTFNYSVPDGSSYSDPASITQTGNQFNGTVTYADTEPPVTINFDGTIQADGSVNFTLYEEDEPVAHWGRLSPDGRTISGEWSVAGGSGDFSLVRN